MADVLTKEQRKRNMQSIRSKDTQIEIILRKALWSNGIRYRKNYSKIPGKPDIAITKYKIAIFWINKISKNIIHDEEINKKLWFMGWIVIRFWGEEIKKNTNECIKVIKEAIFARQLDLKDDYWEEDLDGEDGRI